MAQSNVDQETMNRRYPWLLDDWRDAASLEYLIHLITDAEADVEFGDTALRERAIAALVAHRFLLNTQNLDGDTNSSWMLSRSQAGQVQVEFVTPLPEFTPAEFHHYYTTKPGVEFVELLRRVNGGGMRLA